GDYQFVQDLGHGAYGGLFLGQSLQSKSYVAIKVLNKSGLNDQQLSLQQLEMDIQSSLKGHPSLLQLYDVLQDDHYIYMIMELCDQGDLFDFVIQDQDQQQNDYRSESLVKDLFIQILQGIQYMHQNGIYHRDIKLENVLLKTKEGNDEDDDDALICKVADFGLATRDRYSMEFGCGSATYLAPEHFADEDEMNLNNNNENNNNQQEEELKPYDSAASDIWSLGILLLAFMFGRNPWQEANYTDGAFNEYLKNPIMLKQQLFPTMSMELYQFLTQHILVMDPTQRLPISDM
ncbi:kinase-like domain-containing protein, partial [Cunninghamella echinulata]